MNTEFLMQEKRRAIQVFIRQLQDRDILMRDVRTMSHSAKRVPISDEALNQMIEEAVRG